MTVDQLDEATVLKIVQGAHHTARTIHFRHPTIDEDDLVSVGMERALKALPRWDRNKACLHTYLSRCIVGAMRDHVRDFRRSRKTVVYGRNAEDMTRLFSEVEGSVCRGDSEGIDLDATDLPLGRMNEDLEHVDVCDELRAWREKHIMEERDFQILMLYYGHDFHMWQIGDMLGVSQGRVSQIIKALKARFHLKTIRRTRFVQNMKAKPCLAYDNRDDD